MRYEVIDVRTTSRRDRDTWLDRAVGLLQEGAIVIHPTSTLYGIGAAASEALDDEIARLKGRKAGKPLIRLTGSVAAVRDSGDTVVWCERARRLAEALWPGPLTLVLRDRSSTGLAVRMDGHPVTLALLGRYGGLMTSTSVNASGQPPAVSLIEVRAALDAMPDSGRTVMLLDAGELTAGDPGTASTVLSLLEDPPRILRHGAVARTDIEAVLGEEVAA